MKTANRESLISYRLRRKPETRASRQQKVLRVSLLKEFCRARGLSVGGGGDEEFHHPFDVPFCPNELGRKPIEKFRVRRLPALSSEILRRLEQPRPENHLPVSVDGDAPGEWMRPTDKPLREVEASERSRLNLRGGRRRLIV